MQDIFSTDGVRWKIVLNFKFDNSTEQRTEERKQKVGCRFFGQFLSWARILNKSVWYECDIYFEHMEVKENDPSVTGLQIFMFIILTL